MIDLIYSESRDKNGKAAAEAVATSLREIIRDKGAANLVVATGASQFELLEALVTKPGIDWSKVTAFHLDEYVGLSESHPASFRRYLRERFTSRLPALHSFRYVNGDASNLENELASLEADLNAHPIDLLLAGIGENGHLAFNDPPADFEVNSAYIVVDLDDICRRQQLGEGWFSTFEDVPKRAISMTVRRIMSAEKIILTVPDDRKAVAVKHVLEEPVSPLWPASVLRHHSSCLLFLDRAAASQLTKKLETVGE